MAYNHYIKIDSEHRIVMGWSDGFRPDIPTNDAICISENGGYQFSMVGTVNPNLFTAEGVPLYLWDGAKVVARSDSEVEADKERLPKGGPTQEQRLASVESAVLGIMRILRGGK